MRTANPALNDRVFAPESHGLSTSGTMTVNGTSVKTAGLVGLLLVTGAISWGAVQTGNGYGIPLMVVGGIGGLIMAIWTIFKPSHAPVTAPIYAALEGLLLGAVSAFYENLYDGIVLQAVGLTISILLILLVAYRERLIQVTEKVRMGILCATGAIMLVYLATFVLGLCGIAVPYIHSGGPIGIGISLVIVVVAAANLLLDFDFIEQGANQGLPKYMEWYAAFGLLVTLIWLYLELLRLLSKLRGRD